MEKKVLISLIAIFFQALLLRGQPSRRLLSTRLLSMGPRARAFGQIRKFVSGSPDPYHVLRIPRNATEAEIRTAFNTLTKQYHPDLNPGDKAAEENYKQVTGAYMMLKKHIRKERRRDQEIEEKWRQWQQKCEQEEEQKYERRLHSRYRTMEKLLLMALAIELYWLMRIIWKKPQLSKKIRTARKIFRQGGATEAWQLKSC